MKKKPVFTSNLEWFIYDKSAPPRRGTKCLVLTSNGEIVGARADTGWAGGFYVKDNIGESCVDNVTHYAKLPDELKVVLK